MVLVDFRVRERKGRNASAFKIIAAPHNNLKFLVRKALTKFLGIKLRSSQSGMAEGVGETVGDNMHGMNEVDQLIHQIKSISCNECDLTDMLHEENSDSTPTSKGFDIELKPLPTGESPKLDSIPKGKKLKPMQEFLMKQIAPDLDYLIRKVVENKPIDLAEQVIIGLYEMYQNKKLGYADKHQEKQLENNSLVLKNVLCFVEKHWKVLLRTEAFPDIPICDDAFHDSKLLIMMQGLKRLPGKNSKMT